MASLLFDCIVDEEVGPFLQLAGINDPEYLALQGSLAHYAFQSTHYLIINSIDNNSILNCVQKSINNRGQLIYQGVAIDSWFVVASSQVLLADSRNIITHMHHKQHFTNLVVSSAVCVAHDGLAASRDISKHQVILSVRQDDAICYSTIPHSFKDTLAFLKNCKFTQATTNIERKIDQRTETLLFYLIYLKSWRVKQQIYKQWLSRPLSAMYYFDRQVIEQSQNCDLLINYVAERNHLTELTKYIYKVMSQQPNGEILPMLFNCATVDYSLFKSYYEWSYHFVNNRSFGYTEEFTLIPIFDMMNHSTRNNNVHQVLTHNANPAFEELRNLIEKEVEEKKFESDNEDDDDVALMDSPGSHMDIHYHVVACEDIKQHEEILIKYGNRNNQFLLEGYGFVQEFNPYDSLIIFLDPASAQIYFDSVKSNSSPKYKFKRGQFNLTFFLDSKRYYFQQYYKKQWKAAKVIWSVPKDLAFQRSLALDLLARMQKHQPPQHVFSEGKGRHQMMLFEKERRSIYREQVRFIQQLLECTERNEQIDSQQIMEKLKQLPLELRQYCELLLRL